MDLGSIDLVTKSTEGVKMFLKHPTTGVTLKNDKDEDMFITLTGPHHPQYKKVAQEITDRRLAKRKFKLTTEELQMEQVEYAVVSVKEWNIQIGGQTPPTGHGHVRKILSDPKFSWIREQITAFLDDDENFLTVPSSTNSNGGVAGATA